jgi:hypothetical protein
LRRASPYDPFPEEVRDEYDRVLFAYKFLFSAERLPSTASLD